MNASLAMKNLSQDLLQLPFANTKRGSRSTPATALITSGSLLIALWFCLMVTDSSQLRRFLSRTSESNVQPAFTEKQVAATQSRNNWLEATDLEMEIGYGPLPDLKVTVFLQGDETTMYHWHLCPVVDQSFTLFPNRIHKRKFLSCLQAEKQHYLPCFHCSRIVVDEK